MMTKKKAAAKAPAKMTANAPATKTSKKTAKRPAVKAAVKPAPAPQTPAARREAQAQVRAIVARFAAKHAKLIDAVRRALRARLPTALEVVYEYRDFLVISVSPSERGYEGVFALRADAAGVKLFLNQGAAIPDPHKLLRGSGTQARALEVRTAADLTRPEVVALLEAAIARTPVPFARSGEGAIVIRSAGKKRAKKASAR